MHARLGIIEVKTGKKRVSERCVKIGAAWVRPLDVEDRVPDLKEQHGIGYCNITKCCTRVCPEHIHITDNAIIPLKERVVDRFYDPLTRLLRIFK